MLGLLNRGDFAGRSAGANFSVRLLYTEKKQSNDSNGTDVWK
jgi:hypothetical protein